MTRTIIADRNRRTWSVIRTCLAVFLALYLIQSPVAVGDWPVPDWPAQHDALDGEESGSEEASPARDSTLASPAIHTTPGSAELPDAPPAHAFRSEPDMPADRSGPSSISRGPPDPAIAG